MKVRTIPTPGGQLVDVIPDKVYAARSGASEQALRQWAAKRPILGALWIGGPVEDDSGKATSKLHATAVELGYAGSPSAITGLINGMSHAVKSDRRGRRTYRIELETLPERWATKLLEDSELNPPASSSPDGDGEVATEPLETIEEPEATESAEELLEAPSAILESLQVEEGGGAGALVGPRGHERRRNVAPHTRRRDHLDRLERRDVRSSAVRARRRPQSTPRTHGLHRASPQGSPHERRRARRRQVRA